MTEFAIRPYAPADAAAMGQLYFDAARQVGARRYSPEQVAAWAPAPADAQTVHRRAGDGRVTLVAIDRQGEVAGYIDLEADGHVDHLYCRPDTSGQGLAARLLQEILALAAAREMPRLYVEASELARGLFERHGFTVIRRREFEVRGVAMHNYAMEHVL